MKRKETISRFGFFNVDKPSGITSGTVVNKCKWLCGVPCGHMGTLDPLASGVLPVGIGKATRLFDYFLDKEKEYIAKFTFGVTSDTLDSTGELCKQGHIPTADEIASVLPSCLGEIMQVPPKYSAKNVNGQRGYDLARKGVDFELAPKKVKILGLELLGKADEENTFEFKINCGGGTYIRSLARDIASALGTSAVMSALNRTQSGVFTKESAIPFSLLEQDLPTQELEQYLIPTESVLPFETLRTAVADEEKLLRGLSVEIGQTDGLYKLYANGEFYGIAEVVQGYAKAKTKLC